MVEKISIEIPFWVSHYNLILYSTFYFCEKEKIEFQVVLNKELKNGVVLKYKNKVLFFDYSDDIVFLENNLKYDFYFKRSLLDTDYFQNIIPLNFQINVSYNSFKFLKKIDKNIFFDKKSRVELIRAIDYFNIITNLSHNAMDISNVIFNEKDNLGRVIFQTRLWNPDNNVNIEEKHRRILQNEFRINSCRIIKKQFKNSIVGIYPDKFSEKKCNDILLNKNETSKMNYLKNLNNIDIAIADDGLKDTPGWKIGEYALYGKAIITTPINTIAEKFIEGNNYLKLSDRNAYQEIPDLINQLIENKKYLEMKYNNYFWAKNSIDPKKYLYTIFAKINL